MMQTHTKEFHEHCLYHLCRICGRRVLKREEKQKRRKPYVCAKEKFNILLIFDIRISKDSSSAHSPHHCRCCHMKMRSRFVKQSIKALSTLRKRAEECSSIWTEFDPTLRLSECNVCRHFLETSRGCCGPPPACLQDSVIDANGHEEQDLTLSEPLLMTVDSIESTHEEEEDPFVSRRKTRSVTSKEKEEGAAFFVSASVKHSSRSDHHNKDQFDIQNSMGIKSRNARLLQNIPEVNDNYNISGVTTSCEKDLSCSGSIDTNTCTNSGSKSKMKDISLLKSASSISDKSYTNDKGTFITFPPAPSPFPVHLSSVNSEKISSVPQPTNNMHSESKGTKRVLPENEGDSNLLGILSNVANVLIDRLYGRVSDGFLSALNAPLGDKMCHSKSIPSSSLSSAQFHKMNETVPSGIANRTGRNEYDRQSVHDVDKQNLQLKVEQVKTESSTCSLSKTGEGEIIEIKPSFDQLISRNSSLELDIAGRPLTNNSFLSYEGDTIYQPPKASSPIYDDKYVYPKSDFSSLTRPYTSSNAINNHEKMLTNSASVPQGDFSSLQIFRPSSGTINGCQGFFPPVSASATAKQVVSVDFDKDSCNVDDTGKNENLCETDRKCTDSTKAFSAINSSNTSVPLITNIMKNSDDFPQESSVGQYNAVHEDPINVSGQTDSLSYNHNSISVRQQLDVKENCMKKEPNTETSYEIFRRHSVLTHSDVNPQEEVVLYNINPCLSSDSYHEDKATMSSLSKLRDDQDNMCEKYGNTALFEANYQDNLAQGSCVLNGSRQHHTGNSSQDDHPKGQEIHACHWCNVDRYPITNVHHHLLNQHGVHQPMQGDRDQIGLHNSSLPPTWQKQFNYSEWDNKCLNMNSNSPHKRQELLLGRKSFTCKLCGKSFRKSIHLHCHSRLHTKCKRFKCPECNKSFNQKSLFLRHTSSHGGEKLVDVIYDKGDENHSHTAENNVISENEKSLANASPNFDYYYTYCPVCNKNVRTIYLKTHIRIHNRQLPRKCNVCQKRFLYPSHLQVHMRTHTGERPFLCSECGMTFPSSGSLASHMKSHLKISERPFKCDDCGKGFVSKSGLRSHKKTHIKVPFVCSVCGRSIKSKVRLKVHMRVHTEKSHVKKVKKKMQFPCHVCDRICSSKYSLTNHTRTHTGEKPFQCSSCDKSFSSNRLLKIHTFIHTTERPLKCNKCEKSFMTPMRLHEHMKRHTNEKPFKCDECGKCFALQGYRRDHMKRHNRIKGKVKSSDVK